MFYVSFYVVAVEIEIIEKAKRKRKIVEEEKFCLL